MAHQNNAYGPASQESSEHRFHPYEAVEGQGVQEVANGGIDEVQQDVGGVGVDMGVTPNVFESLPCLPSNKKAISTRMAKNKVSTEISVECQKFPNQKMRPVMSFESIKTIFGVPLREYCCR